MSRVLLAALVAAAAIMAPWMAQMRWGPRAVSPSAATSVYGQMLDSLAEAVNEQHTLLNALLHGPPGSKAAIKEAKGSSAVPTINLSLCEGVCKRTGFPAVVAIKCASCLILLCLPSWTHTADTKTPNRPLARLPIYESGYTRLAAVPLLYPRRWVSFDLRAGAAGLTDYAAAAQGQTLDDDNWGGGVNPEGASWEIGGVTRPRVSTMRASVPPVCVEELGWITPEGPLPCPGADNATVDVHFPSLAAVGGEALPLAYGDAEKFRAISQKLTEEAYASPMGAARATFDTMNPAYSTLNFFKNVTSPERLAELEELYGPKEWFKLGAEGIAAEGDLVEVDLTYFQGLKSTSPGGPWWVPSAHALFRATGGGAAAGRAARLLGGGRHHGDSAAEIVESDVELEPVAIRLSNAPDHPDKAWVYTPAKSETAYVAAATVLRCAAVQSAIWVGHVYQLHIHSSAVTAALYNTVDREMNVYAATHPLRQVLDFFADPTYVAEFHASLFAGGYASGPGTAVGVPDLLSMWNAFADKGVTSNDTTWAGATFEAQLKASGLSEERFRGGGAPGSFAALPAAAFNLRLRREVVQPYAEAIVDASYASDADVAADAQLQAFGAALVSAHGSNLGRINDGGAEFRTKQQLARFIEDFVTIVMTHGMAHLQDFSMRVLNVALTPPRLGQQTAPDPTAVYSEQDQLKWIPTTGTAARQYTFVANFIGTTMLPATNLVASQQWLKGAAPAWEDGLPLFTGPNAAERRDAHLAFIRGVSDLIHNAPRSPGFRPVETNFQWPTRMPRVINI